ncbi:MAG TPA: hypothetical protein PKN44_10490 [Bacteroidales bacterium]|nr:hypothetical protein [Bacteroidales bacterium]
MPKYECRTCRNSFVQAATANMQCPACGSNNIFEVYEAPQQSDAFRRHFGIILSCFVGLLMLIILFFVLPASPRRYRVAVDTIPENCGFRVAVTEYGFPVDTSLFRFSADSGKTLQPGPFFAARIPGRYKVMVNPVDKASDTAIYLAFRNSFIYSPAPGCNPAPPDPCDCRALKVTGVEKIKVGYRDALVVHVSQRPDSCGIQYSVSGKFGKYQKDSVFYQFNKTSDSVFVKSAQCGPVGWDKNPFVIAAPPPPVAQPVKPSAPAAPDCYTEDQTNPKPYPTGYYDRGSLIDKLKEDIQEYIPYNPITVSFIVESTGEVDDLKISSINVDLLKTQVSRSLLYIGHWNPGYRFGTPVKTRVKLYIPANP